MELGIVDWTIIGLMGGVIVYASYVAFGPDPRDKKEKEKDS